MADTDLIERDETPAEEFSRLVIEYNEGARQNRAEAWNLIADFAMEHCDTIIRALRAPSPSPAPGVVEALREAADRFEEIRLVLVHYLHEPERSAFWKAVDGRTKCQAALASLSQPAKGEREGDDGTAFDPYDHIRKLEARIAATPANPAQGVSEAIDEGLEILVNLIDSITRHGNYTPESTCMFIDQAGAAFRAARASFVQTRASDARLVASAPGTVADERDAFEAWAVEDNRDLAVLEFEDRLPGNNHYYAEDSTNQVYIGWCARAALTAAIGAGGQAVAYQWRKRDRVMKHDENWSYVDYHTGLKIAEHPEKYEVRPLYTHPAPSGQAVAAIEALPRRVEKISGQSFSYVKLEDVTAILSTLAHPVQPGWHDMASAPKAGEKILYCNKFGGIGYCHWDEGYNEDEIACWWDSEADDEVYPVAWLPADTLPAGTPAEGRVRW